MGRLLIRARSRIMAGDRAELATVRLGRGHIHRLGSGRDVDMGIRQKRISAGRREIANHLRSRHHIGDWSRLTAEPLETRLLLSTVNWDGGPTGNGTNFLDPVNW